MTVLTRQNALASITLTIKRVHYGVNRFLAFFGSGDCLGNSFPDSRSAAIQVRQPLPHEPCSPLNQAIVLFVEFGDSRCLPVRQPFSFDHWNEVFHALAVRLLSRIPTEFKFVDVLWQVFTADAVP